MDNISLSITNLTYTITLILSVSFSISVYLKSSRTLSHILFLFMGTSVSIFQIAHVIGINAGDSEASQIIFMFTLVNILVICFMIHWLLSVLDKSKSHQGVIIFVYSIGLAMIGFFILKPEYYLLASEPKLYLPLYYVAGKYYWVMVVFFVMGSLYAASELIDSYRKADIFAKIRIKYFMWAVGTCAIFGPTAFLLALGVNFDPIVSVIYGLYIIPLAYGILKYDLMDIKVIAKKALIYAAYVTGVGLLISVINLVNTWMKVAYPVFPEWFVVLTSGALAVFIGGVIWEKMRDLDVLKYEFVTIITHKFRTPLTRIKWATEMLRGNQTSPEAEHSVVEIEKANEALVELTDLLASLSNTEDSQYTYKYEHLDLCQAVKNVVNDLNSRIKNKGVNVSINCPQDEVKINADARRISFVLQTLVENAASYTNTGGNVSIRIKRELNKAVIEVQDSGIGISREDMPRIFMKFFRSHAAKAADTEGIGIGLFISKHVLIRHGGTISVHSDGLSLGSLFTVKLPAIRFNGKPK